MQEIKIEWNKWNVICDFVPKEQFVTGIYVDDNDKTSDIYNIAFHKLGLIIKINDKEKLAKEGDYLVKGKNGKCLIMSEKMFSLKNKIAKVNEFN